jgi:hypothetical protein
VLEIGTRARQHSTTEPCPQPSFAFYIPSLGNWFVDFRIISLGLGHWYACSGKVPGYSYWACVFPWELWGQFLMWPCIKTKTMFEMFSPLISLQARSSLLNRHMLVSFLHIHKRMKSFPVSLPFLTCQIFKVRFLLVDIILNFLLPNSYKKPTIRNYINGAMWHRSVIPVTYEAEVEESWIWGYLSNIRRSYLKIKTNKQKKPPKPNQNKTPKRKWYSQKIA